MEGYARRSKGRQDRKSKKGLQVDFILGVIAATGLLVD